MSIAETPLRMKSYLIVCALACLFCSNESHAQWSRSSQAESTLYVCPGFYPGLITFLDGSSIVVGVLQSYVFSQKLDPYGNHLWSSPTQVYHNDSSYITDLPPSFGEDWGGAISDGDGGLIVFWYDHRGSDRNPQSGIWMNNAIMSQRVNRFGMVSWNTDGLVLVGPESGIHRGKAVGDGGGGFVIVWTEDGYQHPGIPDFYRLRAARYDNQGTKKWEAVIDSSQIRSDQFTLYRVIRGGERVHIDYYAGNNRSRIVTLQGSIATPLPLGPSATITSENDSVIYVTEYPSIGRTHKIGPFGDTLWSVSVELADSCLNQGWYLVPDRIGGVYMMITCGDTLLHVDESGNVSRRLFAGARGGGFGDGVGGIVMASATTARRYNSFGQQVWPTPVVYLNNPSDTYFRRSSSDWNGGVIFAFWTTRGGISAHHTGRTGSIGVITNVNSPSALTPTRTSLSQNYPNPYNPITTIKYDIAEDAHVSVKVFDVIGREVISLVEGNVAAGSYTIPFDGTKLGGGVYFYKLSAGNYTEIRKMVLLK